MQRSFLISRICARKTDNVRHLNQRMLFNSNVNNEKKIKRLERTVSYLKEERKGFRYMLALSTVASPVTMLAGAWLGIVTSASLDLLSFKSISMYETFDSFTEAGAYLGIGGTMGVAIKLGSECRKLTKEIKALKKELESEKLD